MCELVATQAQAGTDWKRLGSHISTTQSVPTEQEQVGEDNE